MSQLVGMDVEASHALAAELASWGSQVSPILELTVEAEVLSQITCGASPLLGQVDSDGAVMAAGIRRAADALLSFTLGPLRSQAIADAVAALKGFKGSENDPIRDELERNLRSMVSEHTLSDDETAEVMAMLLAAHDSVSMADRDTSAIDVALRAVLEVSKAELDGAISGNDPRIDGALNDLHAAVREHAASEEQARAMVAELLKDAGTHDPGTVLQSVISDLDKEVVALAFEHDVAFEVAIGYVAIGEVDALTRAIATAPGPEAEALKQARNELVADLVGDNNPAFAGAVIQLIDKGASTLEAFAELQQQEREKHRAHVAAVAEVLDVDMAAAEPLLLAMASSVVELVQQDFALDDAAYSVEIAMLNGLDIRQAARLANAEDLQLSEALTVMAEASLFAMTVPEYYAYQGLREHFDAFDTAQGGKADQVVSVSDLLAIVNNVDQFNAEVVAAAQAILDAPHMSSRIDSAAEHLPVVDDAPFGSLKHDDFKISAHDLRMFEQKQVINAVLSDLVPTIDVASQGGDPSRADGELRDHDFERVLSRADELSLSDAEIQAIETVLEADWYDPDWWQRHGDNIVTGVTIVAGAALFLGTGGLAAPVTGTLWAVAGGAAIGAASTLGENALRGEDLTEDLLENTMAGAVDGFTGASVGMLGLNATPIARVVASLEGASLTTELTADGILDPIMEHVLDDEGLEQLHDTAATVSGALEAGAIVANGLAAVDGQADELIIDLQRDVLEGSLELAHSELVEPDVSPATINVDVLAPERPGIDPAAVAAGGWLGLGGEIADSSLADSEHENPGGSGPR